MIAPRDLQFFDKYWHPIGNKRMLSPILESITRVPQDILKEGLSSNRPCIAQIMSWAANRMTTRVEDRAYSLMGLLDVNMPMLYGEGKKAFHRLQPEIIRTSNDQSIFAWGCNDIYVRTGSILADDPSFFRSCDTMELMNQDEFIESLRHDIPEEEELPLIGDDRFGTFPITNRGIQMTPGCSSVLMVAPTRSSKSHCHAALVHRVHRSPLFWFCGNPITIDIQASRHPGGRLQLCQVYLRYQDTPHCDTTFEIDDSAMHRGGFTYSATCPEGLITGSTVALTSTDILDIKYYSASQGNCFAVGFGHWFDQNWIHVICKKPGMIFWDPCDLMLKRAPEYAQSVKKARSGGADRQVYVCQTRLP